MCFFAGANGFAKAVHLLGDVDIHPLQVVFSRFLFAFLAISPFLVLKRRSLQATAIPLWHLLRVLLGMSGVFCVFWAVTAMPLGDVTAIAFSSPLFTMIFAGIFLHELVGRARAIAAVVGFAGVVIMVQPSAATFQPMALVAFAAAVIIGGEVMAIRKLAQHDNPLTILAINNLLGAVLSGLAAFTFLTWPTTSQLLALAAVGVVMVAGQFIFVKAMAMGEANFLAPFYYANLIFAALWGFLFFAEIPLWTSYLGAALIVGSGIYISLKKT